MPAQVAAELMGNGHGACCWMNDWKDVAVMLGGAVVSKESGMAKENEAMGG